MTVCGYAECCFMLSMAIKPFMLSVIMLNVVMLSVVVLLIVGIYINILYKSVKNQGAYSQHFIFCVTYKWLK
jgi:hypothetical protein